MPKAFSNLLAVGPFVAHSGCRDNVEGEHWYKSGDAALGDRMIFPCKSSSCITGKAIGEPKGAMKKCTGDGSFTCAHSRTVVLRNAVGSLLTTDPILTNVRLTQYVVCDVTIPTRFVSCCQNDRMSKCCCPVMLYVKKRWSRL